MKRSDTGRLIKILKNREMAGSEPESSGEKLKAEITEQIITLMREMFTDFKKDERQERQEQLRKEREERGERLELSPAPPQERREQPPAPPLRPFDLDYDEIRQRQLEDDQETMLAEPMVRQRLEVPVPTLEEPVNRPRAEI